MGHAGEIEAVEFVERWSCEHVIFLSAVVGRAADVGVVDPRTSRCGARQRRSVETALQDRVDAAIADRTGG
jgi:hypothetical protein